MNYRTEEGLAKYGEGLFPRQESPSPWGVDALATKPKERVGLTENSRLHQRWVVWGVDSSTFFKTTMVIYLDAVVSLRPDFLQDQKRGGGTKQV